MSKPQKQPWKQTKRSKWNNNNANPHFNPRHHGIDSSSLAKNLEMEQEQLARQLEKYIDEFSQKVEELTFKPLEEELIIMFVMNLHPRWKRLLEPVEHTFVSWSDAAVVARYHSVKMSAILGVENKDNPLFQSPESRQLLSSGHFIPNDHPSRHRQNTAHSDDTLHQNSEESTYEDIHSHAIDTESVATQQIVRPVPPPRTKLLKSNNNHTLDTDDSSAPQENADPSQASHPLDDILSVDGTDGKAPSEYAFSDVNSVASFQSGSQDHLTSVGTTKSTPQIRRATYICRSIPYKYRGRDLPFLELTFQGHKVLALLAKLSWKSSAVSDSLRHKLGLPIYSELKKPIETEFGQVTESTGEVYLMVEHPEDSELSVYLSTQVLPSIYGGSVDLVLGGDFFEASGASLNKERVSLEFLRKRTTYTSRQLMLPQ